MSKPIAAARATKPLPMSSAAQITSQAKSNLAFTFIGLPKVRREALVIFYAYCRVIDDIADDHGLSVEKKQALLTQWTAVLEGTAEPNDPLQEDVRDLQRRYDLDPTIMTEVIRGCASDLHPQRFGTWEDLQKYSYQVASSVGLTCLPLFGASANAKPYAIALGQALQLTNIIRDVGEDLRDNGRIYLPLADLLRFQYTERDLVGHVHDSRFLALMTFQADRADALFAEAETLLPPADREALLAPKVMGRLYQTLLQRIRKDQFHVFDRRYRLSKPHKLSIFAREFLRLKIRRS